MVTVQKANVVLDIEDDNVEKYLSNGFSVVDANGNIIKAANPTTIHDYQVLCEKLSNELQIAKKEIEALKQDNAKLNEKLGAMTKSTKAQPTQRKPRTTKVE